MVPPGIGDMGTLAVLSDLRRAGQLGMMLPFLPLGEDIPPAYLHTRAEVGLSWKPSFVLHSGEPKRLVVAASVVNASASFFSGSDERTLA